MTIRQLREMVVKLQLPDESEVVIYNSSDNRDHGVRDCYRATFCFRYFGGGPSRLSSTELECLVLAID
jgi:hypothetical protein